MWFIQCLVGTIILTAIVCAYAHFKYGSVRFGLLAARGHQLVVSPASRDLGTLPNGATVSVHVEVANLTSREVRVIGSKVSCSSCLSLAGELPDLIPPMGRVGFDVTLTMNEVGDTVDRSVYIFTDSTAAPVLRSTFVARLLR